jgi:hypothetical protein
MTPSVPNLPPSPEPDLVATSPAPIPGELEIPENIRDFSLRFGTEKACAAYLFKVRYPNGFVCPKCGARTAWRIDELWSMICNKGHHTSITAGTVMHRTRQPLTTWFHAAYLVSTLTPGISGVQFQRQLAISRYETAFQLLHKLRSSLVNPDREPLHTEVEVDETFIGGRGSAKTLVIGAVEVVRWQEPILTKVTGTQAAAAGMHGGAGILVTGYKPRERAGRVRLRVIPDESAVSYVGFVTTNVDKGAVVHTDGDPSYASLTAIGYAHQPFVQRGSGTYTNLHLHRIFSNLEAWLAGTHHGAVSPQHLQAYLNEFSFRFNRRFWVFPTFLRALTFSAARETRPEYATLYATKHGAEGGGWVHPFSAFPPKK